MCDAKWGRISDLGAIKILLLIKTSSKSGGRNPVPNVISLPRALPNEQALHCTTFSNDSHTGQCKAPDAAEEVNGNTMAVRAAKFSTYF